MADDELQLERIYTIPLRKLHRVPRTRRAPVAMRMVEDFLVRHMKPEREGVAVRTAASQRGYLGARHREAAVTHPGAGVEVRGRQRRRASRRVDGAPAAGPFQFSLRRGILRRF